MMDYQSIHNFATLCGLIKNVKRSGWLRYLPADKVQSVGDHSARIAMLTIILKGLPDINQTKCLQMALIHDIAQGIVGDYTPHDKITPQQKHKKQYQAVQKIFSSLNNQDTKKYYITLWLQYQQGITKQSCIVKDLDRYQMIQQAFTYQKQYGIDLEQFYGCVKKMKTKQIKGLGERLLIIRERYLKDLKETKLQENGKQNKQIQKKQQQQ